MSFNKTSIDGLGVRRVLSWRPSPKDPRDLRYVDARFLRVARLSEILPSVVDLRSFCSKVEDQGSIGSCTAQAVVGGCEFLQMKRRDQSDKEIPSSEFSRLFAYYNGRRMMGWWYTRQDSGCYIRSVIKAAARYGVCDEALWPYDTAKYATRPSVTAYADATRWQLTEYASLSGDTVEETLDNIRSTVAAGYPVAFGFNVYSSFMTEEVARTGIAPVPDLSKERPQGGHAVLIVGYNDNTQMFLVRNSWGETWGMGGYFYLPYWFLLNKEAEDFWSMSGQENGESAKAGWFSGLPGFLFAHEERSSL